MNIIPLMSFPASQPSRYSLLGKWTSTQFSFYWLKASSGCIAATRWAKDCSYHGRQPKIFEQLLLPPGYLSLKAKNSFLFAFYVPAPCQVPEIKWVGGNVDKGSKFSWGVFFTGQEPNTIFNWGMHHLQHLPPTQRTSGTHSGSNQSPKE